MSKLFDVHVGYGNTVYAYQENAGDEAPANSYASYSALLDRMDQTGTVDSARWKLPCRKRPACWASNSKTSLYTSPEYIIYPGTDPLTGLPTPSYRSNSRNNRSYLGYVGVDQSFTPDLTASVRVGLQYLDYYNFGNNSLSPYVDASVTYRYMPQSTVQVGIKHQHNATDVAGQVGTSPVLDEESTDAYVAVHHQVTKKLTGLAHGAGPIFEFQRRWRDDFDGSQEDFYILNL